jgi:hypothetical protein
MCDLDQSERLNGFHYRFYAGCDVIPNVSLADYGPEGMLRYPWYLIVALGSRFNLPRMDNFFLLAYWKQHWCYYATLWLVWIGVTVLNVVDVGSVHLWVAVSAMCFTWIWYYVVTWGILWQRKAFMALFTKRENGLQFWEGFLWAAWMGQYVTYTLIAKLNFDEVETQLLHLSPSGWLNLDDLKSFYQHPVTISAAWILMVVGTVVKSYAAFLSGVNNYYCYDMMLDRPNARFVDSKLYKVFSSPTYHIGYVDGYGLALFFSGCLSKGSPTLALVYTFASHIGICVVNHFVEQKFVKQMYLSNKLDVASDAANV